MVAPAAIVVFPYTSSSADRLATFALVVLSTTTYGAYPEIRNVKFVAVEAVPTFSVPPLMMPAGEWTSVIQRRRGAACLHKVDDATAHCEAVAAGRRCEAERRRAIRRVSDRAYVHRSASLAIGYGIRSIEPACEVQNASLNRKDSAGSCAHRMARGCPARESSGRDAQQAVIRRRASLPSDAHIWIVYPKAACGRDRVGW